MKLLATGMLGAAIGLLLCCTAALAADDDLRYSAFEERLAALESQAAPQQPGVQAANFLMGASAAAAAYRYEGRPTGGFDAGGPGFEFPTLWPRPHVNAAYAGDASVERRLAPRGVCGYDEVGADGVGAGVAYFDDAVEAADSHMLSGGADVLDMEAANRFQFLQTDLVVGGDVRAGELHWIDTIGTADDAFGMTLAADMRTRLGRWSNNRWAWVYGGRMAVLGGDWEGESDFIDTVGAGDVHDDRILVHELYAGLEFGYLYNGYDLYTRVTFELQRWQSDALATLNNAETVGFVGPGVRLGVDY